MSDTPFLFFSNPSGGQREKQKPRAIPSETKAFHFPPIERQEERIDPKFIRLESSFQGERAELLTTPVGLLPEQAIVLETVGKISDFITAVKAIDGMEWLGEVEEDAIPVDDDFFSIDEEGNRKDGKATVGGRLFLTMVNQRALQEILSLWRRYKKDPEGDLGPKRSRWKNLFQQLRDVRPWSVQDSFLETGIVEVWREQIEQGSELIRFEVELWFRSDETVRHASQDTFVALLEREGGRLVSSCVIEGIEYHGLLAELPLNAIRRLVDHPDVKILHSSQVMFFRPVGQAFVVTPVAEEELGHLEGPEHAPLPDGAQPVVALFDGLPLTNHQALANRLIVDDPDGWAAAYSVQDRKHGTTMASLIVNGDLSVKSAPLSRPLYVRPIMKPDPTRQGVELIPDDVLPIDLIHRAVRRLFDGDAGESPTAPHIRVINLSIGDTSRPYHNMMSSWARLLDWLAWRYKVLFLVSAGNHPYEIDLGVPQAGLTALSANDIEKATIVAIAKDAINRRLLSPSESMNALTIGAAHSDGATIQQLGRRRDLLATTGLPSPINALGLGHNRMIKPEILLPGGRQLYNEKVGPTSAVFRPALTAGYAPGILVASPGVSAGDLNATIYTCGTSNATALATRYANSVYDTLVGLSQRTHPGLIHHDNIALVIKALLVHAASWGDGFKTLSTILKPLSSGRFKEYASRFLGYGLVDHNRLLSCTEERATIIGVQAIGAEQTHVYQMPLPPSLSAKKVWRRLTVTLAWFSTTDASSRNYRQAALSFAPPKEHLTVGRVETADHDAVKRGTVQHEIFEGDKADPFTDGSMLQIKVTCKSSGLQQGQQIPYALVVTLETKADTEIPIYQEIKTRIPVPVAPKPR